MPRAPRCQRPARMARARRRRHPRRRRRRRRLRQGQPPPRCCHARALLSAACLPLVLAAWPPNARGSGFRRKRRPAGCRRGCTAPARAPPPPGAWTRLGLRTTLSNPTLVLTPARRAGSACCARGLAGRRPRPAARAVRVRDRLAGQCGAAGLSRHRRRAAARLADRLLRGAAPRRPPRAEPGRARGAAAAVLLGPALPGRGVNFMQLHWVHACPAARPPPRAALHRGQRLRALV